MDANVPDSPLDPLTRREYEILQLLAEGLSDQEAGEHLFLSTGTIKWHLKNIYSKLGVHKRTAAVARARAFGLIGTAESPQATSPISRKHNLPYQTTAFIGRETDTANILSILADPSCRLISLVGIGGIGKTRLAVQCAGQLVDTFADGVWFVSLDSVSASFLPSAISDALHLHLFGHDDLHTQLLSLLRNRRQLLIFDGFEHLVAEAAYVAHILAAAPKIKILVTSREVLNLTEECVYPVGGLATPSEEDTGTIESFGATRLFIDRATRIRQDFSAADEKKWVVKLCLMTGGMPLAIELLTTWLKVLSCQEILNEFARNLDFVAGSRRDLPERHQSIRAVFAQSWHLLSAEEQSVFKRIGVFRGGFSREAAEQIAGASLWTLASLVDKSLITLGKDQRYDLHPLLRHYAEEKLGETSEADTLTRFQHSQYFARSLFVADSAGLTAPWHDAENVWAGLAFAVQQPNLEIMAEYGRGLWHRFEATGWYRVEESVLSLYQQSIQVLQSHAVQPDATEVERQALAYFYECLANSWHTLRQYEEARAAYQAALQYTRPDQPIAQARLYRKMGAVYAAQRIEYEAALGEYQRAETALGPAPSTDDLRWWQEWIQIQLETVWLYYGWHDIEAMRRQIEGVEHAVHSYGTLVQRSKLLHNRMLIDYRRFMFRDLPDETLQYAVEALETAQTAGNLREIAWLQNCVGFTHLWRDELDEAEPHFLQALNVARAVGDASGTYMTALAYLPLIYRRRQQIDEVEHWAMQGLDASLYAKAPMYIGAAHTHLSWIWLRRGDNDEATLHCENAFDHWAQLPVSYPFQWMAYIPLLAMALHSSALEEAIGLARRMLEPTQQQLLDPLPQLLNEAVRAWDNLQPELALQRLRAFCEQAKPFGYL